ncbi:MAG: YbfB/YjiJ family MFS transporter [Burkholderiales bacterium]|nr:YbfB/YjiJ family MFS transporter [Burkholderiales bacterium]OJX02314.1 MAG: MFS transporter [Burkholderiales bacterium 70-64]
MSEPTPAQMSPGSALVVAAALALGAAVSLGLGRFSYALLLAPMRDDLGWSYLTAGAMNTANAAGYLVGALLAPRWLGRFDARALLLAGSGATALLLAAHGAVLGDAPLYALRLSTGVASAATFVSGGLLAARLGVSHPRSAGLLLGVYYGGTGLGIILSTLMVPPLTALAIDHAWQWAWVALGAMAAVCTALTARATRALHAPPVAAGRHVPFRWRPFTFGLAGYLMFGLGYIGYMTFVITLLREQRLGSMEVAAFFVLLGAGVVASSWIWARLLQRCRGGEALALLNGLLALATVLPVLSVHPLAVYASGLLFGTVFLSLVASTTALVRHNQPPAAWPGGIAAFTIVFAVGQIVGPSGVGWIADGPGGLPRGLAVSALVLLAGAVLAWFQRPLGDASR